MVHPALYLCAIGIGISVCLYTLLLSPQHSQRPQQAHRRQSADHSPFANFRDRDDPNETVHCPICLEILDAFNIDTLDCGHRYHKECVQAAVKNKIKVCPMCRKPFKYE